MRRKSTTAFLMCLPLITLLVVLVAYPAGSAIHLSMLDRGMTKFVGLDNFARLFGRHGFWMIVYQTSLFAISAVVCKAIVGFVAAHLMHNIPHQGDVVRGHAAKYASFDPRPVEMPPDWRFGYKPVWAHNKPQKAGY